VTEHDEGLPACQCTVCLLAAGERFREHARRVVAGNGIAPWAHALLGPGWTDDKGDHVAQPIKTLDLAQRALGDVFDHIERAARAGRERCTAGTMYSPGPFTAEQRITRQEAVDVIRMINDSLDYARVHLGHLHAPPSNDTTPNGLVPGVGDQVLVVDEDRSWPCEVTGVVPTHEGFDVRVRDKAGELHTVDARDIRVAL
jgi:hypothetical protein